MSIVQTFRVKRRPRKNSSETRQTCSTLTLTVTESLVKDLFPSPSQITSYMIIGLALAAIISFALLIRRKRRTSDASGQDLERRVANLSSNLQAAARVIGEIEKEIQARQKLVDRLKHDAERSEALAQLHSDEVEAVAQALRGQLSGLERRSFRSNFVLSLTFFAIGVITSILVNVFVP